MLMFLLLEKVKREVGHLNNVTSLRIIVGVGLVVVITNRFDSYWRWYNGVAVLSFFYYRRSYSVAQCEMEMMWRISQG